MITNKTEIITRELLYYVGSLDYPCDFCDKNSYENWHLTVDGKVTVICEDCLKRAKEGLFMTQRKEL